MHFFCDFEAINSRIIAAAFVSLDGKTEEHWLMKPSKYFRKISGVYARLLPYSTEQLLAAPLLQHSAPRFRRIIAASDSLWFYGPGDMRFFCDSLPLDSKLLFDFSERYVDAKQLVEEVLTPIYVQNTDSGEMINIRNIVSYLEDENINARQENELFLQIHEQLKLMEENVKRNSSRLAGIFIRANEKESIAANQVHIAVISRWLKTAAVTLHPQTLFSRDFLKELRWLRTKLSRIQAGLTRPVRALSQLITSLDTILTIQGKRFTLGKASIEGLQELIATERLPLKIIDLFPETGLDRDVCLGHFGREIGLLNAASILLGDDIIRPEGVEHNALFDSHMLRLVILSCFERIERLQPFLTK